MPHGTTRSHLLILTLALLAVPSWLKLPLLYSSWLPLDDPYYVLSNEHVRSGISLKNSIWAFTSTYYGNWMPLTWLSYQFDASIHGLNPLGYHATNIVLDYLSAVFFFLFLSLSTKNIAASALSALLFSLHPAHVEPVAWISSRKDVLAGCLAMLTLLSYHYFSIDRKRSRYLLLISVFSLALLAKPSTAPLPLLLLLLDYWPYKRLIDAPGATYWSCLREKLPLLVLSVAALTPSFFGQLSPGADIHAGYLTILQRVQNVFRFLGEYTANAILPIDLAIQYPHPLDGTLTVLESLQILLLFLLSVYSWKSRTTKPWLSLGLGWFYISLLLNLQIIQIGNQPFADRHLYFAVAGFCLAASWAICRLPRIFILLLGGPLLIGGALLQLDLISVWQNPKSVFTRAVVQYPNSTKAWENLGNAYQRLKDYQRAEQSYLRALHSQPESVGAFLRLRDIYRLWGKQPPVSQWILFAPESIESLSFSSLVTRGIILAHAQRLDSACAWNGTPCSTNAERYILAAKERRPNERQTVEALHTLAATVYGAGDCHKTLKYFELFLTHQTNRVDARLLSADCAVRLNMPELAEKHIAAASRQTLSIEENKQVTILRQRLAEKNAPSVR